MINLTQKRVWSSLIFGWAVGLWAVWAVLNWFPFVETGRPMILPVAGAVLVLFIGGLVVDLPSATPDRVVAVVFIGLILWSTWLLHGGSRSIGLSLAALAGLLAYWQQLDRLSQQADCSMLKRPHVVPWLFWAAMLEGLWLMMPITALLPDGEPLGMVLVVGFLWMLASVFGAPSGHYAHETQLPEVKAPTPIIGVFFIPWGIGVLSMVLGAALGQTGVWVAWGYVAASLVSAGTAFISRLRIFQATQESNDMTQQPSGSEKPLALLQTTFANMLSRFGHQLPDDDVLHRRRGRIGGDDDDDGDYGYGDVVTYLFGQDERGEYLDFYMRHRFAGDQHIRIYEDGSSERLEVISPFGPRVSDDPVENERLRREDREEYQRIRGMLDAKGFPSSY